ncbi:Kinase [uncultured virus]|nr:Kinase [uncultured virus]
MIIGILGEKSSGKDTCADYLVNDFNFKKEIIAKPLKKVLKILFNFSDEQLYGDSKELIDANWGNSPRVILQYLGTDIFRKDIQKILPNIKDNFWINKIYHKYKFDKDTKMVISDVRFQNEVDVIHSMGGKILKIKRRSLNNNDNHESEKYIDLIDNYDFLLENDGTKEELYAKINEILNKFKT